jgi:hypothetical protein
MFTLHNLTVAMCALACTSLLYVGVSALKLAILYRGR